MLKRTLLAMLMLDLGGIDNFELLVSDNGSADKTRSIAKDSSWQPLSA